VLFDRTFWDRYGGKYAAQQSEIVKNEENTFYRAL